MSNFTSAGSTEVSAAGVAVGLVSLSAMVADAERLLYTRQSGKRVAGVLALRAPGLHGATATMPRPHEPNEGARIRITQRRPELAHASNTCMY